MRQPGQRDRYDEGCEQQQVGGKHPARHSEFIDAPELDHGHMKLPRQTQNGGHCQDQLNAESLGQFPGREQALVLGIVAQCHAHVPEAVENSENDKQSDGQEGQQLDQGFKGDGPHQAAVMFAGVHVAGAEEHCEQGQRQRNVQRQIVGQRAGRTR